MRDGNHVTYKNGTKVYRAYRDIANSDWNYVYTLVPIDGGPKRYRVSLEHLRMYTFERVPPVETSKGSVKRPKGFRRLPEYSGCTRHTYVGKKWVYKLGRLGREGLERNKREASLWLLQAGRKTYPELEDMFGHAVARSALTYHQRGVPVAECHLLPDGTLMMERVRSVNNLNRDEGAEELTYEDQAKLGYKRPEWEGYVDCGQIGYTDKGELVAYDL